MDGTATTPAGSCYSHKHLPELRLENIQGWKNILRVVKRTLNIIKLIIQNTSWGRREGQDCCFAQSPLVAGLASTRMYSCVRFTKNVFVFIDLCS